jgi:hypothetical protein
VPRSRFLCILSLVLRNSYDVRPRIARFFHWGGGVRSPPVKWNTAVNAAILSILNGFAVARSVFLGPRGVLGPLAMPLRTLHSC